MSTTNLTSKDICAIIDACGKSGVLEFKYGRLSLKFAGFVQYEETLPNICATDMDVINDISDRKDDINESQENLEEMLLTDPEKYEELVSRGELEHAES